MVGADVRESSVAVLVGAILLMSKATVADEVVKGLVMELENVSVGEGA